MGVANDDERNRATLHGNQVRARLEELGYGPGDVTASSPNKAFRVVDISYTRREDGARIIVRKKADKEGETVQVDVYKEVSQSNDWPAYLAAIT